MTRCVRSGSTSAGPSRTQCSSPTARSGSRRCPRPSVSRTRSSPLLVAVGATSVGRFTHGTTIATNALLERRGARTALVTNEGFEHVLHLRRQTRAHLYRPCAEHPPPLVPLDRCVGVRGRTGPDGELVPLDLSTLPDYRRRGDRRLAALLLSRQRPRAGGRDELRRRYPDAHVVASHEVAPEFREYERASTTAIDAYLGPVLARYLGGLADACADRRSPLAARHALVGRSGDAGRGGCARGIRAAVGASCRRRGRGEARCARRVRERALVRHGRNLDGCLRDRRRSGAPRARAPRGRPSSAAADPRRAHGRGRWRIHRVARRGRRVARRTGERASRAGACLLRTGRDASDGHRRQSAARTLAHDAAGRDRARCRPRPSGRSQGSTRRE